MPRSVAAWRRLAAGVLVVCAFAATYYPTARKLAAHWAASDMYSYGFLVPIISAYLIWLRRDLLRQIPWHPSYGLGTAVFGAGLLMLIVGRVSSTVLIEELSLPISIVGVTLLMFGRQMTRALTFPLAYLLAMIPFWDFLTDRVQEPFQLYSASMGVAALRLFDLPVLREGVLIYLPNRTLEVADVCSGVNQLVAILCLGVPLAHLRIRSWLKRAIIVAAAVLIAVLSNGVRVAMISLFAYYGITGENGDVHGPYSILRTTLISGIGFVILFWLIGMFSDVRPAAMAPIEPRDLPASPRGGPGWAWAVAVALLAGTAGFELWHRVSPVPLSGDIGRFPTVIGRWHVVSQPLFSKDAGVVPFDKVVSRRYAAADGSEVDLLLGYFEHQRQGHELVGFEMSQLLAPAGAAATTTLSGNVRVKDFVTSTRTDSYYVTYVYLLDGRSIAEGYQAKWWLTWNALSKGRTNGGIVVVRTRIGADGSTEAARSRTHDFIEGVLAQSARYLPS